MSDPPEIDEQRPREQTRRMAGTYKEGVALEIQISPARLDILLVPAVTNGILGDDFGPFEPLLLETFAKVEGWLSAFPFDISRGALGTILVDPAESRLAAYAEVMKYAKSLKIELGPEVSDLIFQINHPMKSSAVDGVTINRLMKFSAIMRTGLSFAIATGGQPIALHGSPTKLHAVMELDVSTASGTILSRASLGAIFQELSAVTRELAAHGEP